MCEDTEVGQPSHEFKGVFIPKAVWFDSRLTPLEKILLGEIDALDGDGGCTARNEYIAEFCQCSVSKVEKTISKLKELGYVWVESFNGRTRVLRSSLTHVSTEQNRTSVRSRTAQACGAEPHVRDGHIYNLDSNKDTSGDSNRDSSSKRSKSKYSEEDKAFVSDVISHLNERTGSRYRPTTKAYVRDVLARKREGYELSDFKTVIDKKCAEWIGTDMEKHLVPSTLFSQTHFDSYLNQPGPNGGTNAHGNVGRQQNSRFARFGQRTFDDLSGYDD